MWPAPAQPPSAAATTAIKQLRKTATSFRDQRQSYSGVFASLPQSEERQESDDDDDGTDDIDDPVHEHFLRLEGESPARRHDITADQRSLLRPDNLYASAQTIPRRFSNIWP